MRLGIFLLFATTTLCQAAPVADIKLNGKDGPIAVARGDAVAVSLAFSADTLLGRTLDWWLLRHDGSDWTAWATSGTWGSGLVAAYQGAAFDFGATTIWSGTTTAVGTYHYYFGVDSNANRTLDAAASYYDAATAYVYTSRNDVADGGLYVDIYDPVLACNGTTMMADSSSTPRVIEVDMLGRVVWEYQIPASLRGSGQFVGMDTEPLSNGNVLLTLSGKGVFEIDRSGNQVWSYLDSKVSHDADRLGNGNTLVVYGNADTTADTHIKEVDATGKLVWSWSAQTAYLTDQYRNISKQGWTHANAVSRLDNGNTLVSLRNFDLTAEITPSGSVAAAFDWGSLGVTGVDPHEPELQANGNLLACLQNGASHQAVEVNRGTGAVVWQYRRDGLRTSRDCNRLPNGNTLIVGVLTNGTTDTADDESVLFEITTTGQIVWQLRLRNVPVGSNPGWFYKAYRTCS